MHCVRNANAELLNATITRPLLPEAERLGLLQSALVDPRCTVNSYTKHAQKDRIKLWFWEVGSWNELMILIISIQKTRRTVFPVSLQNSSFLLYWYLHFLLELTGKRVILEGPRQTLLKQNGKGLTKEGMLSSTILM
jgi:hypothetical protein